MLFHGDVAAIERCANMACDQWAAVAAWGYSTAGDRAGVPSPLDRTWQRLPTSQRLLSYNTVPERSVNRPDAHYRAGEANKVGPTSQFHRTIVPLSCAPCTRDPAPPLRTGGAGAHPSRARSLLPTTCRVAVLRRNSISEHSPRTFIARPLEGTCSPNFALLILVRQSIA